MTRLLGGLLLLALASGTARAGSLVEFPNTAEQPGPARLLGYLARPSEEGRFPAVVVLPGCTGISGHSAGIADTLQNAGYVALTVDSLGPRGLSAQCGRGFTGQTDDAYAALHYLSEQPFVIADRIAVLGQSMGGSAALRALQRGTAEHVTLSFRAGIAYYPGCSAVAPTIAVPTLILVGARDDWTSAESCRQLAELNRRDSDAIELVVYPGAYHAFDVRRLQPGRRAFGHWLEYDEPAARDAGARVRDFLAAKL